VLTSHSSLEPQLKKSTTLELEPLAKLESSGVRSFSQQLRSLAAFESI